MPPRVVFGTRTNDEGAAPEALTIDAAAAAAGGSVLDCRATSKCGSRCTKLQDNKLGIGPQSWRSAPGPTPPHHAGTISVLTQIISGGVPGGPRSWLQPSLTAHCLSSARPAACKNLDFSQTWHAGPAGLSHFVAEASDARSPLRAARTYLLTTGALVRDIFAGACLCMCTGQNCYFVVSCSLEHNHVCSRFTTHGLGKGFWCSKLPCALRSALHTAFQYTCPALLKSSSRATSSCWHLCSYSIVIRVAFSSLSERSGFVSHFPHTQILMRRQMKGTASRQLPRRGAAPRGL